MLLPPEATALKVTGWYNTQSPMSLHRLWALDNSTDVRLYSGLAGSNCINGENCRMTFGAIASIRILQVTGLEVPICGSGALSLRFNASAGTQTERGRVIMPACVCCCH